MLLRALLRIVHAVAHGADAATVVFSMVEPYLHSSHPGRCGLAAAGSAVR